MKARNETVFLRGRRVILRPLDVNEVPMYARWVNDPQVTRFLKTNMPVMEIAEKEWIERQAKDKNGVVLVICTLKGVPIGIMGIHNINWVNRTGTTGAFIGEKKYWGKGLGTDAKMHFLQYLFDTLNLRKICSKVYDFNGRSLAYNEHCGYKQEGLLKRHVFREGKFCDVIELAVFREDWLPYWKKFLQRRKS